MRWKFYKSAQEEEGGTGENQTEEEEEEEEEEKSKNEGSSGAHFHWSSVFGVKKRGHDTPKLIMVEGNERASYCQRQVGAVEGNS